MRKVLAVPFLFSLVFLATGCQSMQQVISDMKERLKVENVERRAAEKQRMREEREARRKGESSAWRARWGAGVGHEAVTAPLAESAPDAETAPAQPAGPRTYVVRQGDILGRIAKKFDTTVEAICRDNGIKDPAWIVIGQTLVIPNDKPAPKKKKVFRPVDPPKREPLPAREGYDVYRVQAGDVMSRIAKKHGTTMSAILKANGLTDADKLRAGKDLYIPRAATVPTAPAAKSAAAKSAAPEAPVPPTAVKSDAENFLDGNR